MAIELDFAAVLVDWPILAKGVGWTVFLSALAAVVGVTVGVGGAWARSQGPAWLRTIAGTYVELIRNTPFIVQLFFIFFGLPAMGLKLSPEVASMIAMVVNLGAYATEIIRAGVDATPRGQIEAGLSLAMGRAQIFTRGAAASAGQGVACTGQSNHHRDAGLCSVWANFGARAQLRGQPDSVA